MARLSTRQLECRRITQEKARMMRKRVSRRRLALGLGSASLVAVAAACYWCVHSGVPQQMARSARDAVMAWTADAGFSVQRIYLEGRRETPMHEITRALALRVGDPILSTSVDTLRARLQSVDRVKTAQIERVLPNTLHIHMVEREPVALWQNKNQLHLVDDTGMVMEGWDIASYRALPVVVGEDAPSRTPQLLEMLARQPEVLRQMKAAVRVGERRWNLRLSGDIEVKLPEQEPEKALAKLAMLQSEKKLLEKSLTVIDMRLPDRVFIRLKARPEEQQARPKKPVKAQET